MQILNGNVAGPLVIERDTVVGGNVTGDVIVRPGCRLDLQGNLDGDIVLEGDAVATVDGNLIGTVRKA